MIQPEATLAERLCKAQSPHDLQDWEGRDGYYVAACRVSPADVPGLIAIAQGWSDVDRLNDEVGLDLDEDDVELLPVTAWRALADLQADAAVEPLIDLLRELDEFDDWVSGELPHVFGKIGKSAILPLTRLATDSRAPEFARSVAARGLGCVAKYHAAARDRIVAGLTELMTNAVDCDVEFTTALLVELVDLQAVQAAEPIERAFAGNLVDVGMLGDWEMVRRKLGVEGLGLKMPDNPHNSIARLRIGMGLGIFSDDPIFSFSEINHAAVLAYYQRACDTFSGSSEAQRVIDRNGRLGWVRSFLEFGLDMRGEIVDAMTLDAVTEFLFDYAPRKISVEADAAGSIIFELTMFWEYVDRVYKLPEAKSIALWLKADDLISRLKAELSNPENFGMAKSMVMMGKSAGFDMTSEAGLAEFMAAYNQSLVSRRTPTPGAAMPRDRALKAPERVGRNDPCPCGSGKKFKKCCR